jgi:hypothetical protein
MGKGKNSIMNGRALFSYNPAVFNEEGEENAPEKVDTNLFANEEVNEEEEVDFD